MREGLRSRTRLAKGSGAGGVVEKVGVRNESFDLNVEGSPAPQEEEMLNLTVEKKEEVECAVIKDRGLDLNVSPCGSVDLAEDVNDKACFGEGGSSSVREADGEREVGKKEVNDKGCFSGGGSVREEADVVETEVNKIEGSNDSVLIGGRVLRSRSKRGGDKKSCNGEKSGILPRKSNESGGFEMLKVKKEYEETDEFVTNSDEDEKVKPKQKGRKKNLKRKRGRPPKIKPEEEDQLVDQLPHKRGRPSLVRSNEHGQLGDQLMRKRGRPPKTGRKGKTGFQKGKTGLPSINNATVNAIDDTYPGRSSEKELEKKEISPVKKNKCVKVLKTDNNGVASPMPSNTVKAPAGDKSVKKKERQLVRDQIMERLTAAGWRVDYRSRNGREYCDSVYVSPDGKTHWSITLAYTRLKEHYEAGKGEGKVYAPGFKFTPIPEEDFKILTKVMCKERNDKGKPRTKDGKTVDRVNTKVKKGRSGSGAGMGKLMKGKTKRKRSLNEEGNADVTSSSRMRILVRDHKRHKMQNKKRYAPLVRNAQEEIDSETNGYVPYNGKRTVFAWMIDLGRIVQNEKVHYFQNGRKFAPLVGEITGDGICCGCCNEIITISEFEAHAGSKLSDPLRNIFTEEGTSLLQCLLDSWNKQDESEREGFHFVDTACEDPNDDTCGVCGDGGDLICCDGCPSTFHQSCLDIEKFPSGDWHCIYCCCKFCGLAGGSSKQRDGSDDFTVSTLLTCHLCQEKYHRSCIEANGAETDDFSDLHFCGNKCEELSLKLEVLLGVKHEVEDGFSWTFIRRSGVDASEIKPNMVECNSKLAVAVSVMDECFMPYIDHRSGTNLIHGILYNCGSNFKRLNYSGFVTAILERGDEIISVATVRIHGNQLAEMPFIGTRYMYRRQGMCRRLLDAIECALSSLNVELLVIPAISELRETWTSVFGFEPLDLTSKKVINNMNLLVFPHVDMLQKKIPKHKFAGENLIPTEVSNLEKSHSIHKVANNCDGAGSADLINSAGIPTSNACQIHEFGYQLPEGPLNGTPDITSNIIHQDKYPDDVICQFVCQTVLEVLAAEAANACDCASETCYPAEDKSTGSNCTILDCDQKPIDLDSQSNKCCVAYEEKQCLGVPHNSTEAAEEGHNFIASESKDFADNIHHDSHNMSDSCELKSKADCVQPYFVGSEVQAESVNGFASHSKHNTNSDCATGEAILTTNTSQNITEELPVENCEKNYSVVSVPNDNEAEMCSAKAPHLETNINTGDCQSILASSDFCEKVTGDTDVVPNHKPGMTGSSELAEPDLQLDQTARSNAPIAV